jgi:hypothetical protein
MGPGNLHALRAAGAIKYAKAAFTPDESPEAGGPTRRPRMDGPAAVRRPGGSALTSERTRSANPTDYEAPRRTAPVRRAASATAASLAALASSAVSVRSGARNRSV